MNARTKKVHAQSYQCGREGNPPCVAKEPGAIAWLDSWGFPVRIRTDEMLLDGSFEVSKPFIVGTRYKARCLCIGPRADLAEYLSSRCQVILSTMKQNILTFKFSTCLSLGLPAKFRRYGGYSPSRACLYSIFCFSGIRHSSSVSRRVEIASCHIRRLACGEVDEMSRLSIKSISRCSIHEVERLAVVRIYRC